MKPFSDNLKDQEFLIEPAYLTPGTKRRSGIMMSPGVKFIVAHDTGNPGSTARGNVRYYENSRNEMSASAHIFVDDNQIIECIPAITARPEKAWHVLYGRKEDNILFGFNSNDAAIGVEYCFGNSINADEAYRRFIWVMAYACWKFGLDPAVSIVGHHILDPARKSDPANGLMKSRRSYSQMLKDVPAMFLQCSGTLPAKPLASAYPKQITAQGLINIRKGEPFRRAVGRKATEGMTFTATGIITGESVSGIDQWYVLSNDEYCWSGAVK